jgi:hypothetical protein
MSSTSSSEYNVDDLNFENLKIQDDIVVVSDGLSTHDDKNEKNGFVQEQIIPQKKENILDNENLKSINKNMESEKVDDKKKRQSVECNGMELLTSLLLAYNDINELNDVMNIINNIDSYKTRILFNNDNEITHYITDLLRKSKLINKFIINFRKEFNKMNITYDDINNIYLTGKTNKHSVIEELNKNLNKKSAKSDIYILLKNNMFIGISVKQSSNATKTNYSVEKMFNNKSINNNLNIIRKNYLKENGFEKFDKSERKKVNRLFYPDNTSNPYWIELRKCIQDNSDYLKKSLINYMYALDVSYNIYEFNSITLEHINSEIYRNIDYSNVIFEEYNSYYLHKNGNYKSCAKLFYKLVIGNNKYRVEIRWKGNIHDASPQFLLHEDNSINN